MSETSEIIVQEPVCVEVPASNSVVTHTENGNMQLVATRPAEMETCQSAMIEWCRNKVAQVEAQAAEMQQMCDYAKKHKHKASGLANRARYDAKQVVYYKKMLSALEQGYHMVPDFSFHVIAVRTDRKCPLKVYVKQPWRVPTANAESLPEGEGDYKSPVPLVGSRQKGADDTQEYFAAAWRDVDFPMVMAKYQIMEAATRVQALKIFDEIGLLPAPKAARRAGDPILVGRIVGPKLGTYGSRKVTNFLIAWYIDTKTL